VKINEIKCLNELKTCESISTMFMNITMKKLTLFQQLLWYERQYVPFTLIECQFFGGHK
jgi:hypothetical protein